MTRVDGQGREHRKDPFVEPAIELGAFVFGDLVPGDDRESNRFQLGDELVDERPVDLVDELEDSVADLGQGLPGRAAVGRRAIDPGDDLILERRDAHLEELVEVRRRDRAELGSLEQRDPGLGGELEHALVELQPAQFPVDEPLVGHRLEFTPPRSSLSAWCVFDRCVVRRRQESSSA